MVINQQKSCANCKHCLVGKFCSPEWISKVDAGKNQLLYRKGQYIFYEGALVFGLHLVTEGKVKIISNVSGSKEQIVRLATDGHVLGRWGDKEDIYENSAVSLEDSVICFINNDLLHDVCLANPEFTFQLMKYYASELRKSGKQIKCLGQMPVKLKIVETLLHLVEIFGLDSRRNIAAAISRQEIAEMAAVNMEQVSREITALKKRRIISTNGKQIIINDLEKLQEIVATQMDILDLDS